jgi:hypothetical protein
MRNARLEVVVETRHRNGVRLPSIIYAFLGWRIDRQVRTRH